MDDNEEYRRQKKLDRELKRKQAREAAEKKKRFGLNAEKKKKLRELIRRKAQEHLQVEASAKAEKKKEYLKDKVSALPSNMETMDEQQLVSLVKLLHQKITEGESEKYDIEFRIRKNDYEINELTLILNDMKGKFIKPTLKKVSKEGKSGKRKKDMHQDFREKLKSTGINKYALATNEEE